MSNKSLKIVILILGAYIIFKLLVIFGVISLNFISPKTIIKGIDNYDKNYYLKEYGNDLDSTLEIFPDNKDILSNANFISLMQTNLFDTDGYIILNANYSKDDFNKEIDRLSKIEITIKENCYDKAATYTNKIMYNKELYEKGAYITINGFGHTYEYALVDENNLNITYIYLAYPKLNNEEIKPYLMKDLSNYKKKNITGYSIYNHSFDKGKSYVEVSDCK